jgi:two-component system cell cycle response regulator DivK
MAQTTRETAQSNSTSRLVLVVDDYADALSMYGLRLRFAGFRVAFATNGEEAVRKALAEPPALIVLDLALPIKDGWTVARELKGHPTTAKVPIIAVSGHVTSEYIDRAYEAGCDQFLPKPCSPDQLLSAVQCLLAAGAAEPSAVVTSSQPSRRN